MALCKTAFSHLFLPCNLTLLYRPILLRDDAFIHSNRTLGAFLLFFNMKDSAKSSILKSKVILKMPVLSILDMLLLKIFVSVHTFTHIPCRRPGLRVHAVKWTTSMWRNQGSPQVKDNLGRTYNQLQFS